MEILKNSPKKRKYGTFDRNHHPHTSGNAPESNSSNVIEVSNQRFLSTITIKNVGSMARDQFCK